jgi:uncharacterized membrane protein YfcA
MTTAWMILIVFLACFTQSVSGFGSALAAMPLLSPMLGLTHAAPLVCLVSATIQFILLIRYHRAFRLGAVWRIVLAASVTVPLGAWALRRIDERITLSVLGIVVLGYALYMLSGRKPPGLTGRAWPWLVGAAAGLLGGAYNTSGPPVVVYGSARDWPPETFKSNLQGFFCVNNLFVLVSHAFVGNLTLDVGRSFLLVLPGIALGLVAGLLLDRFIGHVLFRKILLVLLVVLGVQLLVRALAG